MLGPDVSDVPASTRAPVGSYIYQDFCATNTSQPDHLSCHTKQGCLDFCRCWEKSAGLTTSVGRMDATVQFQCLPSISKCIMLGFYEVSAKVSAPITNAAERRRGSEVVLNDDANLLFAAPVSV